MRKECVFLHEGSGGFFCALCQKHYRSEWVSQGSHPGELHRGVVFERSAFGVRGRGVFFCLRGVVFLLEGSGVFCALCQKHYLSELFSQGSHPGELHRVWFFSFFLSAFLHRRCSVFDRF